jgi:hypothetical protein
LTNRYGSICKKIIERLQRQANKAIQEVRANIAKEAPIGLSKKIYSLPIEKAIVIGKTKIEVSIIINREKDLIILYLDQGTGIYGPKKKLIRPVSKRVMVFEIGGKIIFTKKVKGIKPMNFIKRGIDNSRGIVLEIISKAFNK